MPIDIQTENIPIVDAADTIFGTEHGLTTGQKVKHHGSTGGGLTDNTDYLSTTPAAAKPLYDNKANADWGDVIA